MYSSDKKKKEREENNTKKRQSELAICEKHSKKSKRAIQHNNRLINRRIWIKHYSKTLEIRERRRRRRALTTPVDV